MDNIHGFVHVTGYSGSQVQVSIEKHIYADSNEAMAEAKRDVKMDMSQQGNFVRLYEDGPFRSPNGMNYRGDDYYGYRVVFDFDVQVPYDTELVLKGVNHGDIQVKKTTGDYEIHGLNGGIEMEEITGSGLVSTLNGKVKVTFSKNPRARHSVQDAQRLGGCLFPERAERRPEIQEAQRRNLYGFRSDRATAAVCLRRQPQWKICVPHGPRGGRPGG